MDMDGQNKLHDDKTKFMIIGSTQQLEKVNVAELSVGDISVPPASTARNLGVLFDRNLKFDAQITKTCLQLMRVSAAIPRARPPGNPRATHGLSRGFVAKACPACGALERFCVFGKTPRGHTHGICT